MPAIQCLHTHNGDVPQITHSETLPSVARCTQSQCCNFASDRGYNLSPLQVQPAFLLMSDAGAISQEVFSPENGRQVEDLMQACVMHLLSSNSVLPVAFMTDIRFQQVTLVLQECIA